MGNSSSSKPASSNRSQSTRKRTKFGSFRRKRSKQSKGDPVKLYVNKPNASCRMVWLYCVENDVPFELHFVDERRGDTATKEFHALNPHESVPVLKDGEVVLFESISILYYLATTHTAFAGFGKTVKDRSAAGSLCCWACKSLTKAVAYHFVFPQFVDTYKLDSPEANASLVARGRVEVSACLDTLQNEYLTRGGHDYLLGSEYTVADACVATVLTLLESVPDFDWDPWPKVGAWMEKIRARPKWEEVNENHARYVEKLEMRQKEGFRRRIQHVASTLCPLEDDKEVEEEEDGAPAAGAGAEVDAKAADGKENANEVRVVVHEVKADEDEVEPEEKPDGDGAKAEEKPDCDGEAKEAASKEDASSNGADRGVPEGEDAKGEVPSADSDAQDAKNGSDVAYEPKAEGEGEEEAKVEEAEPKAMPEKEKEDESEESKAEEVVPVPGDAVEKADAEDEEKKGDDENAKVKQEEKVAGDKSGDDEETDGKGEGEAEDKSGDGDGKEEGEVAESVEKEESKEDATESEPATAEPATAETAAEGKED